LGTIGQTPEIGLYYLHSIPIPSVNKILNADRFCSRLSVFGFV